MLGLKFIKVLNSILKQPVISSSSFASFFIVMTNNSPVNFKLIHFLNLDKRIPSKSQFRDFQLLCIKFPKFLMSFLKVQIIFPSNFASLFSVIKHNSSALFTTQALHNLVKGSPLKCKFLRNSSAWVKTYQSPHVNFEATSQFLFQFCIFFHCHDKYFSCKF